MLRKWVHAVALDRAREIVPAVLPWFHRENGPILDLGCGLGYVGTLLAQRTGRQVVFLDVTRHPFVHPEIALHLFDGRHIPFKTGAFATTAICFVLHHVRDPLPLLHEVVRVSQRDVVICEDLAQSERGRRLSKLKDWAAHYFHPRIVLAHRLDREWEALFAQVGLQVRDRVYFRSRGTFIPFQHIGWHLTKTS